MKCIGTKIKQGSMFDDHGKEVIWDYCRTSVIEDNSPGTYGQSAEIVKIKKEEFRDITGLDYKDHMKLVGHKIDAAYKLVENKPVLVRFRIADVPADNKK